MKVDNAISDVTHDDVDDNDANPKEAAIKVDASPAAVKTAGVGISSPAASGGVRIAGAMGPRTSVQINGVYEAMREMSGGMPVYAKVGDNDVCMEYHANNKQWQVKTSDNKGTDLCMALCVVLAKRLPQECPTGKWEVYAGSKWIMLPAITVSLVSKEEVEACREELEREAARVVKGHHNVRITGATGIKAGLINGVYQPTEELCGNVTVYVKMGNDNAWLEYNASQKCWQLKKTEHKCTDIYCAMCDVPVKGLPHQECPAGKWCVWDGSKFVSQRAVTVSLLQDGNDAIVGVGDVDDDETKPKAAAMKVDASPAAVKTAGVGISSPAASGGIRIAGAMGPSCCRFNGVYEATSEMSGDMPVYVKVGDNKVCMEYYAPNMQWQVKPTKEKGKGLCFTLCVVPAKCLPEECPDGKWYVYESTKFVSQPAITVSLVSKDEVEAYREELEREAAREVKGRHNVRITGATGVKAGLINGVYKPTNEMCNNATVYQKVVGVQGGNIWLEYNAPMREWQVKETEHKGTDLSWADCNVPTKRLPQECPAGKWYVHDGTKFVPQPAMKVRRHN